MLLIRRFILLFSFLLPYFTAYAFPYSGDSTVTSPLPSPGAAKDSTQVGYFHNDVERFGILVPTMVDTSITGVQNYDPAFEDSRFIASLGNLGQDYRNIFLNTPAKWSGFDYGIHTFDKYLYQNDSVKYYRVLKTFTQLKYVQGAKKELFFEVNFSRNIFRSLNLGFDLRVISSPGFYSNQKTNHINFVVTAQYFSKTKRYGAIANLLINRLKNYENGGIKNESMFEQDAETNRQLIDVNLTGAQNRIRESGFFMKHYFNLSAHPKNAKDSVFYSRKRVELGRISYSFEYNRQTQNYIDSKPKSGFYEHIYLDSIATEDSVSIKKIVNEFTWTNPSFTNDKKLRLLQLEAHMKFQYIEVSLHDQRRYFLQYIPAAGLTFHPFPSLYVYAYGDYVLGDYNKDDLNLSGYLSQTLGKEKRNAGIVTFKAYYSMRKPGWFYEHYYGNNFRWDTAWRKQVVLSGTFNYAFKTVSTGVTFSRINHFVYLDTSASPRQFNDQFAYIYYYLKGSVDLWRFTFKGEMAYQTIQGTNVLKLPTFLGNLSIYYSQQLFKGAATFQPGVTIFYNTYYYGDGYMPATRSFYLQDRKEIGNYPYMDVFINLKVQRARIFFMYSHFNAALMGSNYYMVPGYPMPDAAFKFGVTWRFFD